MSEQQRMRVALLFGGRSGEHEISIVSARSVAAAIDRERYDVALVGIDRDGLWHLHDDATFRNLEGDAGAGARSRVLPVPEGGKLRLHAADGPGPVQIVDVVFPVLHGPYGEDGTIQGMLEMAGVPYVGTGVLGSAVGMDKDVQKRLLREAGLPVVPFAVVAERAWTRDRQGCREQALKLGTTLFVKPANLGSSVGITKVEHPEELDAAVEHALRFDVKVVVEKGVDAREIECAVLGNDAPEASVPGEIEPKASFYSYAAKYASDSPARLLIPAPLSDDQAESVRDLALRAFAVTECAGMARVDLFLERGSGRFYVNELNTIPGFTSISMYPKLWEASGLPYGDLISRLVELGLERRARRNALRIRPE